MMTRTTIARICETFIIIFHSRIINLLVMYIDHNPGNKQSEIYPLLKKASKRKKTCPKEHQKTKFYHIPILYSICLKTHLIKRESDVRVAVITTYIMHSTSIFAISFLYCFIPNGRRKVIRCDSESTGGRPKGHSTSITNVVRTLKV